MQLCFIEIPAWCCTSSSHGDLNEHIISCNVVICKHSSLSLTAFFFLPFRFAAFFPPRNQRENLDSALYCLVIFDCWLRYGAFGLVGSNAEREDAEYRSWLLTCVQVSRRRCHLFIPISPVYNQPIHVALEVGLECVFAVESEKSDQSECARGQTYFELLTQSEGFIQTAKGIFQPSEPPVTFLKMGQKAEEAMNRWLKMDDIHHCFS